MKPSGIFLVLLLAIVAVTSGCVSKTDFEDFKAAQEQRNIQMDTRMDNADVYDEALACESRLDIYQETTGSDEPIGTRRDEPIGTRRDECLLDFEDIFGDLVTNCRNEMLACVVNVLNTVEDCNACYADCYVTGAWPNVLECAP